MNQSAKIFWGFYWVSFARIAKQILQFITVFFLAKYLSPSDFGLMGIALVVLGFINIFNELGIAAAVIHKQNIEVIHYSSIFWFNVIIGISLTSIILLIAPLIAVFFNNSYELTNIIRVLSINFVIISSVILQQALFEKGMNFRITASAELLASVVSSGVSIYLAFHGFGVWSLVIQSLTFSLINTVYLWVNSNWRPSFHFSFNSIKQLMSFSMNLTGFNFFNYFLRNADSLLIGKFLGIQELGYYSLALKIVMFPIQSINYIVAKVMYPVYSQLQTDHTKFREIYLKLANGISLITFPIMMGLIILSDYFVLSFFGKKWEPIILLIQVLAPVGLIQSLDSTTGSIFQAKGRTDLMLRCGIVVGVLILIGYSIGLYYGITGVTIGYLIVTLIWVYPGFSIPFKLIGMKFSDLIYNLNKVFFVSFLTMIFTFLFKKSLINFHDYNIQLVLTFFFAVVFYILLNYFFNKNSLFLFSKIVKIIKS